MTLLSGLIGPLREFGLRLLQPVRHPHLVIHRRRSGEMLLRLLALARAPVELPEAEVAVGETRAHRKFRRQSRRTFIEDPRNSWVGKFCGRDNISENAKDMSLVATLT